VNALPGSILPLQFRLRVVRKALRLEFIVAHRMIFHNLDQMMTSGSPDRRGICTHRFERSVLWRRRKELDRAIAFVNRPTIKAVPR
jgi:hypothetical protein